MFQRFLLPPFLSRLLRVPVVPVVPVAPVPGVPYRYSL
jgi:hypothetical protein